MRTPQRDDALSHSLNPRTARRSTAATNEPHPTARATATASQASRRSTTTGGAAAKPTLRGLQRGASARRMATVAARGGHALAGQSRYGAPRSRAHARTPLLRVVGTHWSAGLRRRKRTRFERCKAPRAHTRTAPQPCQRPVQARALARASHPTPRTAGTDQPARTLTSLLTRRTRQHSKLTSHGYAPPNRATQCVGAHVQSTRSHELWWYEAPLDGARSRSWGFGGQGR